MKFALRWLTVFLAMTGLDIAFALYVIETAEKNAVAASAYAALIQLFNIYVVSSFIADRRLALACVAGAFVGTYIAINFI